MKLLLLFLPFCGAVPLKEALGLRENFANELEKVHSERFPLQPKEENVHWVEISQEETGALDGQTCYSADQPCQQWTPHNDQNFMFVSDRQTWADAQTRCRGMGGQLAIITNQQDEDFVKGLALGKEAWIGLSDAEQAFSWFWINGDLLSYSDWCLNEPSNWGNVERCVEINYTDKKCWNDLRCDMKLPFVCQRN